MRTRTAARCSRRTASSSAIERLASARVAPLRVCLEAQLRSGIGGVEQFTIGLASGFSRLDDGDERYLFLTEEGHDDWLEPYVSGPASLLRAPKPGRLPPGAHPIRYPLGQLAMKLGYRRPAPTGPETPEQILTPLNQTAENADLDLIHFPAAVGFLTEIPSIFQPHDLQHLHMPEFFGEIEVNRREIRYRAYCDQAELVVVMTEWGRRDIVEKYDLPEEKVIVVNEASVLDRYPEPTSDDRARTAKELRLPDQFLFYPAQTWGHKNHRTLLEAVALIKRRDGIEIPLVCSGKQSHFFPKIAARVKELGLQRTKFVGFVSTLQLRCLYDMATALVFPSRFEGWGQPVTEAFAAGLPVVCSNATSLPDLAGDAALLFDPGDPEEMADQILLMWTDPELRAEFAERGSQRSELFSLEHGAKSFRAHYRRVAGRPLTAEDQEILDAVPVA